MNERIKELREYFGLSRATFGEKSGVSRDIVNNLERGRLKIKEDRIKLICSIFRISEEWLRNGNGDMYQYADTNDYTEISTLIGEQDHKARQAIIDYWNLSEDDKKLFWQFADRFLTKDKTSSAEKEPAHQNQKDPFFDVPDTPEELEAKYPPITKSKKDVG